MELINSVFQLIAGLLILAQNLLFIIVPLGVIGFVVYLIIQANSVKVPSYSSTWKPNWEDDKPKVRWELDLLIKPEWKRFEEVVSDYYRQIGYRSKVTRMGADGGVDVLLFEDDDESPVKLIQCKSWSKKVGVNAVRELYGVMAADGVSEGIFATTSSYTNEAREWVNGKNMELLSGNDLVRMFNALSEEQLKSHLANGLDEDYSTPTCPNCNQKMVSRTAKRGKQAGSSFWGCSNYPRCKQTFKMV